MRRIAIILALSILLAPLAAGAQPEKVWRIGILANVPGPHWDAFRQGLRQLGYVEGQNIAFENRWGEGRLIGSPLSRANSSV